MRSLPDGYRAIVIGASGGVGSAMVDRLRADPRCGGVDALHRGSDPAIDFDDDGTTARAAARLVEHGPFHLIVNAAGLLHDAAFMPEKRLADLDMAQMLATFRVNTFGPALVLRHFAPLLAEGRALMAMLSARVGSIEDNRLGGWYSYRASKAALNMMVKTASIELARTKPDAMVVALHPGTVATKLSKPFRGDAIGRAPTLAAGEMLAVLDALASDATGTFIAYDGSPVPW